MILRGEQIPARPKHFGGESMSPKELMYIEDALGHEKFLETQCNDCAAKLQDTELKTFATQLATEHKQTYQKLYQLLNS